MRSSGGAERWWTQLCVVLLTAICLLTKEVGLVVAGVFVLANLLQMPGIRRSTAIGITLIALAYFVFHFATLPELGDPNKQKATTFSEFSSNFLATIVMFWLGLPMDGIWANARRFLTEPWQWIQIAAGVATLVLLICAWRLAPTPIEREASDAPEFDHRWFLLFGAALLGCAVLGFYYTRHRHGAPAVPLLAYCTYLSMQVLLWRLDEAGASGGSSLFWRRSSPLLVLMAVAGLACAVLWPLRLVNGFEYARDMGGQIRSKWHNAMQERWNRTDDPERPYLVPFAESVELDAVAEKIRSGFEVAGEEGFQLGQSLIRPWMGVFGSSSYRLTVAAKVGIRLTDRRGESAYDHRVRGT